MTFYLISRDYILKMRLLNVFNNIMITKMKWKFLRCIGASISFKIKLPGPYWGGMISTKWCVFNSVLLSHSAVSYSSRPHGLQPTRLLRPWDFRGKSTGVGCHSPANGLTSSLLKITNFICSDRAVLSLSVITDLLQPHGLQPSRLLRPWDFRGKSTGVGCHCLLRGNSIVGL